jgi:hypothetical protein
MVVKTVSELDSTMVLTMVPVLMTALEKMVAVARDL